jgi:NAD(P)-dependent dehydrogenase (short-subunit alcohol dehydrogenase family)
MFSDLYGKHILVIGASRGIGRQLALTLNSLGAKTSVTGRSAEALVSLKSEFGKYVYKCDIDVDEDVQKLASTVEPLDGVCVISGVVKLIPPKMLSKKMIDSQVITNLASPLSVIGALLKRNKLNIGASVVFTSASARLNHVSCTAPYSGAKLGLHGAARSMSGDLNPVKKIRVNTVSFDYVDTDMIRMIKNPSVEETVGVSPVTYTSIPFLFLLSSMSRWISGQMIAADAGRMLSKSRYS